MNKEEVFDEGIITPRGNPYSVYSLRVDGNKYHRLPLPRDAVLALGLDPREVKDMDVYIGVDRKETTLKIRFEDGK